MFAASMPSLGWSPKHGQPALAGAPASVVSMRNTDQSVVGSPEVLNAMSSVDAVPASLMNRMEANQVLVAGSKWHRGSLVNAAKSSWKGAFTLVGPASVLPWVS